MYYEKFSTQKSHNNKDFKFALKITADFHFMNKYVYDFMGLLKIELLNTLIIHFIF